jgi:hypothetical protein
MRKGLIIILLLSGNILFAQDKNVRRSKAEIKFSSINQFALLNGNGGTSYALQTVNGVKLNSWFVGAGVGLDMYSKRSVPVFLGTRKYFGSKPNKPFLYADGGLNYTWLNFIEKENAGSAYSTSPGLYMDAGFGVKLRSKGGVAMVMSAGYSYKQSKETVYPWGGFMPAVFPVPDYQPERLNSQYRRIVVKLGIQL